MRKKGLFLAMAMLLNLLPQPIHSIAYDKTVTFENFPSAVNGGEPIRGADISSILSLEEAGVKFHNDDENWSEEDIFKVLAEHGVNYIRVRVWNQPNDGNGHSYGGGNNDVKTAGEIGRRAAKYGMKLLVDFHYSDFWADPEKQRVPKAWQNDSLAEKGSHIYYYTLDSLKTIREAGADIGMVQIGNETNSHMCGETDMYRICEMMKAGCNAVKDFDSSVLRVLHFADPSSGEYPWYAKVLNECEVDYDVFATSYYPYWHGTPANLTSVLKNIADTYGKYVMVAETAYPYTSEDGDRFANVVSEGSEGATFRYDISVEGQAECFTDVFQAIANVGEKGIGVFYWEPAWLGVSDISWSEQKQYWEKHGSGWATEYAHEYDNSITQAGGSSYDNQGLFNFWGYPMESLNVYKNIYPQAYQWQDKDIADLADGIYTIQNAGSGMYLDADDSRNVAQYVQDGGAWWHFTKNSDNTWNIAHQKGSLSISTDTLHSPVFLGEGDSFRIAEKDGKYIIMTDDKRCFTIHDNSTEEGAWLSYAKAMCDTSQQFVLTLVKADPTQPTETISPTEITEPTTNPKHTSFQRGDVNTDGSVSLNDLVFLNRYIHRQIFVVTSSQYDCADLNGDGKVNVIDLALLKKKLFSNVNS